LHEGRSLLAPGAGVYLAAGLIAGQ